MSALLDQLEGATMTAVRTYQTAPLPFPILQSEGKRLTTEAIKDWDPSRGMSLSSYVITTVKQRLSRYVSDHQNFARIPENKVRMIGPLREAETDLSNRFGREPTIVELSDHMAVPISHITRLRKMQRADILESSSDFSGVEQFAHDASYERVMLAYYSFNPEQQQIFDYSMGTHGKPKLSPGDIATRMGLTNVRVSQLKKQVADLIQPYLG